MKRREFLKASLAAGAAVMLPGCRIVPVKPDGSPEPVPIDMMLEQGARVMWCAPHPDDECFTGGLLARVSIYWGNPLYFLIMTHGEGGECGLDRGCHPDLGAVRGQEMIQAAKRYRATLQHEHFFNAPLPVSSFPNCEELHAIWKRHKDPTQVIVDAIDSFKPDLLLTLDPTYGATGHPEHQLTSRLARAAAQKASHRIKRMYHVVNRYWALWLIGKADPGPVTEVFDGHLPATYKESCVEFMLRATHLHRTQHGDMSNVREYPSAFAEVNLRQVAL